MNGWVTDDLLAQWNKRRALAAGKQRAAQAKKALASRVEMFPHERQVLAVRAAHPELPISECGLLVDPPLTKHAFAGVMRRALLRVERSAT